MAETRTYAGGCHCGAVRFETITALDPVIACNCSRCAKLGALFTFVPAAQFELKTEAAELTDYQFNKKVLHHLFCRQCGIEAFARGVDPKSGAEMVALNVRCLDGVDPATLSPKPFDGKSL